MMNRTRVALITLTVLMTISFITIAAIVKRPGSGGGASIPEPVSYAKPTSDGKFIFVAFGSETAEKKLSGSMGQSAREVRSKYPVPGMYRNQNPPEFLYEISGYAPDENVYLTEDGRGIVRIEGEWWTEKAYAAGTRLPVEEEQKQLDAPAVNVYRDGKLLKSFSLRDLTTDPTRLPHSPRYILWPGGAVLNAQEGRFIIYTQDDQRVIIDVESGQLVSKDTMGFGNRFSRIVILSTLGVTIALALAWGVYFYIRRKPPNP